MNLQFHPLTRFVHGDDYLSFSELGQRSPAAAEHGEATFSLLQLNLSAAFAFADGVEVFFDLPYRENTLSVEEQDEHHRNETLRGIGDLRLGIKGTFLLARSRLQTATTLGLSAPTGRRNRISALSYVDHHQAEQLGIRVPDHSHLQLGSGSVAPIFGIEALFRFTPRWMALGSVNMELPIFEYRDGYRKAFQLGARAGPALAIRQARLFIGFFLSASYAGRDHFNGDDVVGSKGTASGTLAVPNTGRFELSLVPSITWLVTSALTTSVQATIPFYTRIAEDASQADVQLAEPIGLQLGISYNVDLARALSDQ